MAQITPDCTIGHKISGGQFLRVWHFRPTKDRMVNSKPQTGGNNNGME